MSISTVLHHYRFDTCKPEENAAYNALVASTLSQIGFPVWTMRFHGNYTYDKTSHEFMEKVKANAGACELETDHLFDNQWNGAELRLFNWAECVYPNESIREGYWLEQTDAMRAVLRETLKCGYCGAQEPRTASAPAFCPRCLDSEYLKASDLRLTRLVPVCDTNKPRAELTDAERAERLPVFHAAQVHGATERGKAHIEKARRDVYTKYADAVRNAAEERDAALWAMDNAPGMLGNWIFYSHTRTHSFGWRKALDAGSLSELLDVISEFPFAYEIKCDDGRTLSS